MSTGDIAPSGQPAAPEIPAPTASESEASIGHPGILGQGRVTPDLSRFDAPTAAWVKTRPSVLDAITFRDEFSPKEGVEYGWLVEYAKKRFEETVALYNAHDAKAASVLTHLGSGTGLLTIGTAAAVGGGTVPAMVGVAAMVPFTVAGVALWFAIRARQSHVNVWLPPARQQVRYAERRPSAEVESLADFDQTTEFLARRVSDRARNLNWSLRLMTYAVFALALPLLVAIAEKWPK